MMPKEAEAGLQDAKALLAEGRLVPPVDNITANGYEIWKDNPPLYHDLSILTYTKYDVQEWTGKIRKYKAEVVRYADQCRRLEKEVLNLQGELEKATDNFEGIEEDIEANLAKGEDLERILQEESARRNLNSIECMSLRRARQEVSKQQKAMEKETAETHGRIALLKNEIERNRNRHLAALGEKEKLNLERRWFFHERLLLEETTLREIQDIALMKEKLEKLRYCMHKAWRDTKELDLRGHVRATEKNVYNEEWYAARKRTFTRGKRKLSE